jgi:hypothetical protein
MQIINRIQNAVINANVAVQGALVVDSANAHRAYPSFEPCVMHRGSKRSVGSTGLSTTQIRGRSLERLSLQTTETRLPGTEPAPGMWRVDRPHDRMPATAWATIVVNRALCG